VKVHPAQQNSHQEVGYPVESFAREGTTEEGEALVKTVFPLERSGAPGAETGDGAQKGIAGVAFKHTRAECLSR